MKIFDIYIAYVSWEDGGKMRPVMLMSTLSEIYHRRCLMANRESEDYPQQTNSD
ncbi:MAG: hypothetical protein FWH14_08405 [Oscillospiraceae bacterium]|nr:hypothetical protein [Oscillospiraceae bacterium]